MLRWLEVELVSLAALALNLGILAFMCWALRWEFTAALPFYALYVACHAYVAHAIRSHR